MNIVTDLQKLHTPTKPITKVSEAKKIADTLFEEMKEHNAQGLSAIQLGINKSIFVMKYEGFAPICIVNPKIVKEKGHQKSKEFCLSIPGVEVKLKRPLTVRVVGVNQYLKPVGYNFSGIDARRACHEIDHLNGKLTIDYTENSKDESPRPDKSNEILARIQRLKEQQGV